MSFSHQIKLEVLKNKMKEKHFLSFLNGLILTNCKFIEEESFIIKINKSDISFLIKEKLQKYDIKFYRTTKNKNWIVILKKDFKIKYEIENPQFFFAGAFVGAGTISDINSIYYNLQITFFYEEIGEIIKDKLNSYQFNFKITKNKNKFLIYEKQVENIQDFLNAIGANENFQTFFNIKNMRDIQNNANRLANLDVHNQQRLVNAASRDIENYNFILENKLEHLFKKEELIFFQERVNEPFLNLNDIALLLSEKHNIKKTKSGLNHWSIKLNKIVKNLK
ncbi:DNA-binding protein WhiA [Mesomycoplasma lagogenitalium]|uniref:DNA-binding protein WhiA n=1 Tax=Mesomycoplasma lagogenitalium TaxID=171286 RepID=A0ABY8LVJ5_9BACT|nr:DNA-binding protein WhiA [Mesomycoplasma lagogenitalium]WGI36553.1 DNA-binding protein WhiA [Mesomycoplasma lagogenitalium]